MKILKYLFPCIALLFFSATVVYADDRDNNKCHNKDGKKCHEKMWGGEGKWKQCPMHKMMGMGPQGMMGGMMPGTMPMGMDPMMGMGGSFTMIEAQERLFLYNKRNGDVWVCNAFRKTCEQLVVENKDID
jgi:hypothetical protein